MAPASTSSKLLPQHRELVLRVATQLDQDITDAIEDYRWHKINIHRVELSKYRQEGSMELLQNEILHGSDNIQLALTPRLLLSPAAMTEVLARGEKWTVSVKVMVTSQKEKDQIIKHGI